VNTVCVDGKDYVAVYAATPYGVTNHLHIPITDARGVSCAKTLPACPSVVAAPALAPAEAVPTPAIDPAGPAVIEGVPPVPPPVPQPAAEGEFGLLVPMEASLAFDAAPADADGYGVLPASHGVVSQEERSILNPASEHVGAERTTLLIR
jgi:hypothetical protein